FKACIAWLEFKLNYAIELFFHLCMIVTWVLVIAWCVSFATGDDKEVFLNMGGFFGSFCGSSVACVWSELSRVPEFMKKYVPSWFSIPHSDDQAPDSPLHHHDLSVQIEPHVEIRRFHTFPAVIYV